MEFISKNFKKTFIISGNHEYYGNKSIEDTNNQLTEYFKKFNNISFLNNTSEHYSGYCFIGSTLWSKITNPNYEINDVNYIPNFDYVKYNRLNNDKCIIITHHVPSESLIDIKYKTKNMSPYNQWFYCDQDNLIETNKNKIKCWIYGHTHTPSNKIIHGIPFVCNPIGYPKENSVLDFEKFIMIE